MLWVDLVRLALEALGRQKLRTILTTLGIVAGTIALCSSLALGRGVQDAIVREYSRFNELRHVDVYAHSNRETEPGSVPPEVGSVLGVMSDERRERLREMKRRRWQWKQPLTQANPITSSVIRELAELPHVRSVTPDLNLWGAHAALDGHEMDLGDVSTVPIDGQVMRRALVAGQVLTEDDAPGVLISEHALYQLGVVDEADVQSALGKKVHVQFKRGGRLSTGTLLYLLGANAPNLTNQQDEILQQVIKALPHAIDGIDLPPADGDFLRDLLDNANPVFDQETRVTEEYPIVGVFRMLPELEGPHNREALALVDVLLSRRKAEALHFRFPETAVQGIRHVTLEVDDTANVRDVIKLVKARGLETSSLIEQIEIEQFTYSLIFVGMTLVAVLAFVVAALGITNTMLMSVLERTREIGIMKAVGASNWHVSLLFLVEGLLLGVVGGLVGLAITRLAAIPGDAWVRSMLAQKTQIKLAESLFVFRWWLVLGAPFFAGLVTTLAALPPSRRAARIPPVEALREPG